MKHLFLSSLALFTFWTSAAQEIVQEAAADTIANKNNSKTANIRFRCGGNTTVYPPLYIIDGKIVSNISFSNFNPANISDLKVLKGDEALKLFGESGKNGVVLITTKVVEELDHHKKYENLPFKIYDVPITNLNLPQDIYNNIISTVPGVQISNTNVSMNEIPEIRIRGDSNTIYIIDGVRFFDASILNTINPNDIESIKVATDVAASNYLQFNRD